MKNMETPISTKRYIFYRLQFFFYLALVSCTAAGTFYIHLADIPPKTKFTLTLLFVIIAILIGCIQLVLQYTMISKTLAPLQRLIASVKENIDMIPEVCETNQLEQLRNSLVGIRKVVEQSSMSTHEVEELAFVMNKILTSLEKAWNQAAMVTTLTAMGNVCGQVAHDMRGPLSAIKMFLENISFSEDQNKTEFQDTALRATDRLLEMAKDLLEFRRASQIERRDFDLAHLVKTICQELRFQRDSEEVVVEYQGPDSISFNGDDQKLERVLQNLTQNSLQAMKNDSMGEITLSVEQQMGELILQIKDTGPGIPDEHFRNLFSKAFTTKGRSGNGLGLLYCKEVVGLHGGEITAHRNNPHGAVFRIQLPLAPLAIN